VPASDAGTLFRYKLGVYEDGESPERHVRLFKNGRNQAVRIPREFELPGTEAIIRKEGDRMIIEAVKRRGLLAVLATIEPLDDEFPDVDEGLQPADDIDLER
jgi:antitoxin VapB